MMKKFLYFVFENELWLKKVSHNFDLYFLFLEISFTTKNLTLSGRKNTILIQTQLLQTNL